MFAAFTFKNVENPELILRLFNAVGKCVSCCCKI